jgi:uncharacterized protein
MKGYLLDVNVLIALCEPHHVHAEAAHRWMESQKQHFWHTCPLTENAFVRILGNPTYPNSPGGPALVRQMLTRMSQHPKHKFWPDNVSLRDKTVFDLDALVSTRHLTDIYLLGVAVSNGGKLVTLDQHIPVSAVVGGKQGIVVINTD